MELEEFDIEFLALKMAENPQSMLFARLADLYPRKGQNAEAMKLVEDGVKTFPDYYAGYLVLGKTHLAFGEYSRAQTAFQKALDLSPLQSGRRETAAERSEQTGRIHADDGRIVLRAGGTRLHFSPGIRVRSVRGTADDDRSHAADP